MDKFTKTAFAALLTLGLAGSVLTSTTMHAAAWGWSSDDNTWWATDEGHETSKPGIIIEEGDELEEKIKVSWGWSSDDNTWW